LQTFLAVAREGTTAFAAIGITCLRARVSFRSRFVRRGRSCKHSRLASVPVTHPQALAGIWHPASWASLGAWWQAGKVAICRQWVLPSRPANHECRWHDVAFRRFELWRGCWRNGRGPESQILHWPRPACHSRACAPPPAIVQKLREIQAARRPSRATSHPLATRLATRLRAGCVRSPPVRSLLYTPRIGLWRAGISDPLPARSSDDADIPRHTTSPDNSRTMRNSIARRPPSEEEPIVMEQDARDAQSTSSISALGPGWVQCTKGATVGL
jgi:hypothetical protein